MAECRPHKLCGVVGCTYYHSDLLHFLMRNPLGPKKSMEDEALPNASGNKERGLKVASDQPDYRQESKPHSNKRQRSSVSPIVTITRSNGKGMKEGEARDKRTVMMIAQGNPYKWTRGAETSHTSTDQWSLNDGSASRSTCKKGALPIVKVNVRKPSRAQTGLITGALSDSGGNPSYCTEHLANQLQAMGRPVSLFTDTLMRETSMLKVQEINLVAVAWERGSVKLLKS